MHAMDSCDLGWSGTELRFSASYFFGQTKLFTTGDTGVHEDLAFVRVGSSSNHDDYAWDLLKDFCLFLHTERSIRGAILGHEWENFGTVYCSGSPARCICLGF